MGYEVPFFISTKTRFLTVNSTVSLSFTNIHEKANRSVQEGCFVIDEDPVGGKEQNEDLNGISA